MVTTYVVGAEMYLLAGRLKCIYGESRDTVHGRLGCNHEVNLGGRTPTWEVTIVRAIRRGQRFTGMPAHALAVPEK